MPLLEHLVAGGGLDAITLTTQTLLTIDRTPEDRKRLGRDQGRN